VTPPSAETRSGTSGDKYIQIRVKSIEFYEVDAIAIYFYDVTHHVESQKLIQEIQEKKTQCISESQLEVSHEFRAPLSTSLMLLEGLMLSD